MTDLLDRAHDIRKFEIRLYWRRTTYFWTLIVAAFAGFFAIQTDNNPGGQNNHILAFIVANLGFLFSLGWFFINRGSKFWQQSWEIHVDRLEQCSNEKLYRLPAYKTKRDCWLVAASPYSVSKINQITSVYVTIVWIGLGLWSLAQCSGVPNHTLGILIVFGLITLTFCWFFHCKGRTRDKDKEFRYDYCLPKRTANRVPVPSPRGSKSC